MKISEAIEFLEKQINNPSVGLPEEIFRFISRITPMVNVDLLIKDESNRTLLAWRDDIHGKGWHIPGGIIRYKENFETRILKVAENEIGVKIEFDPTPMTINQIICSHDTRGHFVSILYKCFLSCSFVPQNLDLKETDAGYLKWHVDCPNNLLEVQDIYKKYI